MKYLYLFRCSIIFFLILCAQWILDLEISLPMITSTLIVGTLFPYILFRNKFTFLGFILSCFAIYIISFSVQYILGESSGAVFGSPFIFDLFNDSLNLFLIGAAGTTILSWFFLRLPGYPVVELLGMIALALGIFGTHRNFNFDNPKLLSDLAWQYNIEPLSLLIASGFVLSILILAYSMMIAKLEMQTHRSIFIDTGSSRKKIRSSFALIGIFIIVALGSGLYQFYFLQQQLRVANGVGQASEEGVSPLGFNSAMGSTRQPAAVVRLDGDYTENPFQPMMYLRENALSTLGNHELVIAGGEFDTDLHRTAPNERYEIDLPSVTNRKKLSFSAYLLTKHNLAFAIDYPISISPIKNPKPEKFKSAFHSVSVVPTFPLAALVGARAGDSSWNEQVRAHYLATDPDPRYATLAARIVGNQAISSSEAAQKIAQYLSENSIYTLTPNHSVKKGDDQVAPYLFGDMRGYCVHFAHATVFMLRSLGIPARIGAGYLTDLSKAKDGHILLRMSDRHAWAEVYFEGFGWIPFDTKPTRVESHGDSEMDYKLLEELMGILGNDEFLPPEKTIKEPGLQKPIPFEFPIHRIPWLEICLSICGGLLFLKLWIRLSWKLPSTKKKKIFRAYRSLISVLYDIGIYRQKAETFTEFQKRVALEIPNNILSHITPHTLTTKFSDISEISSVTLDEIIQSEQSVLRKISLVKKLIALLNPASCLLLFKRNWI
jgi:hypothetical protein